MGGVLLLVSLAGFGLRRLIEDAKQSNSSSSALSPTHVPPPDPELLRKADSDFVKAWNKMRPAGSDGNTESLLVNLADASVRSCMVANGIGDLEIRDYDRFWVKFYRLERGPDQRLRLTPACCSTNTPAHEKNMTLIFNEGGAGYVLAQSLRRLDRGEKPSGVYVCDRSKAMARLGRNNRIELEASTFTGECCFPMVGRDDVGVFYGVACFCAGSEATYGQLRAAAKQIRVSATVQYAAKIIGKNPGRWGTWCSADGRNSVS